MTKSFWNFLTGATVGIFFSCLLFLSKQQTISQIQTGINQNFSSFEYSSVSSSGIGDKKTQDILNILKTQYISGASLDIQKMNEGAIKGYVEALDDPYTIYMPAQDNKIFMDDLKGTNDFEGIGAVIAKTKGMITIQEVLKDSPAAKAGLKPLDNIVQIGDETTLSMSAEDAVKKIRGPKGTSINLGVIRDQEALKISVTRDTIVVPSINSKVFILTGDKKIGYISISVFGDDTASIFKKEAENLKNENVKAIIVDVRGNGGGYLQVANELASYFIPKDKIVVTGKYKSLPAETYTSRGYDYFQGLPVVVLIDGLSASASEIITLALKQDDNAQLVGTKSFGKGSVQSLTSFSDGSSLKYTVGLWYAPDGSNINHIGINPDVEVKFDSDEYNKTQVDNQLEKAKEIISTKI